MKINIIITAFFSLINKKYIFFAFLKKIPICYCNKIFLKRAKLILALNHFICRCSYYNPYFAFRRSGIHPPFISLFK